MTDRGGREGQPGSGGPAGELPARPWTLGPEEALAAVGASPAGLSTAEAAERLARHGPNELAHTRRASGTRIFLRQFENPIVLLLMATSILAGLVGDRVDAGIILAILLGSALLGAYQEGGALRIVDTLLAMVQVEAEVRRDGAVVSVPLMRIVPGDVVVLNAGDVIPADLVVVSSLDLTVDESALTGESYPAEKRPGSLPDDTALAARTNSLFLGTHVVSGRGEAVAVRTGQETEFGRISAGLRGRPVMTGFEHGVHAFGLLLVRAVLVLTAAIFAVNLLLSRPLVDSLLFSLALAVGLTPQLLPAIVTVSLARGARRMAREKVIVKRLEAIEDFGSMQVLCTDKTGTLTSGSVRLEGGFGVDGEPSERVAALARMNAELQTGFANPIDAAILEATGSQRRDDAVRLDEVPYDFRRKRLSVLVRLGTTATLITKGAFDQVLQVCSSVETADGRVADLGPEEERVRSRFVAMSERGLRVLGVAVRDVGSRSEVDATDERELTFVGFLAFADPPKEGVAQACEELAAQGVSLRMITGDNHLAAARAAELVGLASGATLTGPELTAMDDEELARRVGDTTVFAEVDPSRRNGSSPRCALPAT